MNSFGSGLVGDGVERGREEVGWDFKVHWYSFCLYSSFSFRSLEFSCSRIEFLSSRSL